MRADRHKSFDQIVDDFVFAGMLQQMRCVEFAGAQSLKHVLQGGGHVVRTLVADVANHINHLSAETRQMRVFL